jgi:hypothetical protein
MIKKLLRTKDAAAVTFPYVRAWQEYLGGGADRTEAELARAAAAGAPADAIYFIRELGEWATAGSIRSELLREQIIAAAARIAGRRLRPAPARPRCDAFALHGLSYRICDRPLDGDGACPRAYRHLTAAPQ